MAETVLKCICVYTGIRASSKSSRFWTRESKWFCDSEVLPLTWRSVFLSLFLTAVWMNDLMPSSDCFNSASRYNHGIWLTVVQEWTQYCFTCNNCVFLHKNAKMYWKLKKDLFFLELKLYLVKETRLIDRKYVASIRMMPVSFTVKNQFSSPKYTKTLHWIQVLFNQRLLTSRSVEPTCTNCHNPGRLLLG